MTPTVGPGAGAFDLNVDVVADAALPPGFDLDDLPRLVAFVLAAEGATGAWDVALVLTGDERLRVLHRDFMGLDVPTDVMTFPVAEGETDDGRERGGDVVVSVERAAEQAADYGQTASQEIRFLVVHGVLHLCGWDDATAADRDRMLARQAKLIAAYDGGVDDRPKA